MNLKVSFSWVGLVVFALPMLINLAYAAFPPERRGTEPASLTGFHRLARYRPYDYQGGTQ